MHDHREVKSSKHGTTSNPASPYPAELPVRPFPAVQGLGHLEEPCRVGIPMEAETAYRLQVSLLRAGHCQKESEAEKA